MPELSAPAAVAVRRAQRMVEEAERACAYPMVQARLADGSWTERHADAVLDELGD